MSEWTDSKVSAAPAPRRARPRMFQPGERLAGRFEVVQLLRRGANGDVYLVRHAEFLDRLLALKILVPPSGEDFELAVARFRNEVIAAYSVTHPNVVRIFDYIRDGDVIAFTMEYVVGGDLADLLNKQRRLSMQQVMHLLLQICEGMRAIHNAQIIHRDLKPENILITTDGKVKISDFGTARRGTTLGRKGGITGTIAYLSPEYLRDGQLDQRSDIYSFGIMAYEMITGSTPFNAGTLIETLSMRLRESAKPPHQINPLCPPALSAIVLQCLQADPEERYQSVEEMQYDLAGVTLSPILPAGADPDSSHSKIHSVRATGDSKIRVSVRQPAPPVRATGAALKAAEPGHPAPSLQPPTTVQVKRERPSVGYPRALPQRRKPGRSAVAAIIAAGIAAGVIAGSTMAPEQMRDPAKAPPQPEQQELIRAADAELARLAAVVVGDRPADAVSVEPPQEAPAPQRAAAAEEAPAPPPQAAPPAQRAAEALAPKAPEAKPLVLPPVEVAPGVVAPAGGVLEVAPPKVPPGYEAELAPTETLTGAAEPPGWYIIFNETDQEQAADTVAKELTASGMEAVLQVHDAPAGKLFRVLIGPFTTEPEARELRTRLQLPDELKNSPILLVESKP